MLTTQSVQSMKSAYLALTVLGFLGPNILITKVGLETGNILLYTDIPATLQAAFANDISSAFVIDLLIAVVVFFTWSFVECKRLKMKAPWLIWAITMLFGLSGALPLFLYQRELQLERAKAH